MAIKSCRRSRYVKVRTQILPQEIVPAEKVV